ncbi:MAG: DUF3383 domain-containing protein [Alphaproteobacteria bacterium]|nr:DUF3383 domain-containing protein [Alphaproteobacteria bacterium]
MLSSGLPVSRYVSTAVSLTTPAVEAPAINTGLLIGSSTAIDAGERMRRFANISEVQHTFGSDSPEYNGALIWFSQNPRPDHLMVGRWIQAPAPASLIGGNSERRIAEWQAITNGSFAVTIGGTSSNVTNLNFATVSNLNAVAEIVSNAMTGGSARWNGERFIFNTDATGVAASIGFLTPVSPASGTDISEMLGAGMTSHSRIVTGAPAEDALSALAEIDALYSSNFYCVFFPEAGPAEQEELAAYCEAADPVHYLGVSTNDINTLDPLNETSLAYELYQSGYHKTALQYSRHPAAVASYLAFFATTFWRGTNTAKTGMYMRQPGVPPEQISSYQADALQDRNVNVYVGIANGATMAQYGTSISGQFTDTIWGADALALDVQNALFNVLYASGRPKVPQTDFGVSLLITAANAVCGRYVLNGYLAPGVWNAPGVGNIRHGDQLPLGYYIWAPTVALLDESDRAARRAPLITILARCASAIHTVNVLINVYA